ncbi:MAG: tetratricopeptide repeat protein [Cyanobacteriota bacterium]|nr:tetratricopeptide repeat protein [Cyanobacteriota bacterium]
MGPSFEERFQAGKDAFEGGRYRLSVEALEEAVQLTNLGSRQGGEAQLWLVLAYQASGQLKEARTLCRKLTRHPHPDCRKNSKNVLYILEAPQLNRPKEWLTEIPDLTQTENSQPTYAAPAKSSQRRKENLSPIRFEDLSRMNTRDNGFVAAALVLGAALLLMLGVWARVG